MSAQFKSDELQSAIRLLYLNASASTSTLEYSACGSPRFTSSSSSTSSSSFPAPPLPLHDTLIPAIVRADCAYQYRHLQEIFSRRPQWRLLNFEHENYDVTTYSEPHESSHDDIEDEDDLSAKNMSRRSRLMTTTQPSPLMLVEEYENLPWDQILGPPNVVASSFCVRKGLGRKGTMARALTTHALRCNHTTRTTTTSPSTTCPLKKGLPETVIVDTTPVFLSRPAWLDYRSALAECLFEVDDLISASPENSLFILKPSLTNKGAEIHIVRTLDQVSKLVTSLPEIGHWVVQRYMENPLLLPIISTPMSDSLLPSSTSFTHHKFHLRVYVLAVGALSVFVYPETLILIAPRAYTKDDVTQRSAHITNTCVSVQDGAFEELAHVRKLSELPSILELGGRALLNKFTPQDDDDDSTTTSSNSSSCSSSVSSLSVAATNKIYGDICSLVSHSFAALEGDVGAYMPLPNCWELYGVDFLVQDDFQVQLLEFNPSPDVAQTGERLDGVIAGMMEGMIRLAVDARVHPVYDDDDDNKNDKNENTTAKKKKMVTSLHVDTLPYQVVVEMGSSRSGSTEVGAGATSTATEKMRKTAPGILDAPVRDIASGWDCVYTKLWGPAHAQMNISVT